MPKTTVVPGGSATPDVEMRFIELKFGEELLINLLDVRRLIEETATSLQEVWNRQQKFARSVFLDAEVLGIPIELMPATIWPDGEIDLMTMGSASGLTEELLPDVKFDTQVDYYIRIADPVRLGGKMPTGILARIRSGKRDNPSAWHHVDAIMAYNKLTYKSCH